MQFIIHLTIEDAETGRKHEGAAIPVLKSLDREIRKKFLADALDRLFAELEKDT